METIRALDPESLRLFAAKGREDQPPPADGINANAIKVRRVTQVVCDWAARPLNELRVLDLGCGEGVYAVELAIRGAEVLAVDARTDRMNRGVEAARRIGLPRLRFEQSDIRRITPASHGTFDAVLLLGILYHLDEPDVFTFLENVRDLCRGIVVIDTHVALAPDGEARFRGHGYAGARFREHGDADPANVRRNRLASSLDNTFSFWFTREALVRLLRDLGFTSVYECQAPPEPCKPDHRVTLAAVRGSPVRLATYPWINDRTENEIAATVQRIAPCPPPGRSPTPPSRCLLQRLGDRLRRP